jgi:predicted exporter
VVLPENKHLRRLLYFFYAALGILSAWLLIRFVLPWLSPFILAFITARLIERSSAF